MRFDAAIVIDCAVLAINAGGQRYRAFQCFDNVRPHRLPTLLQDQNPTGQTWRLIDGQWSVDNVAP